MHVTTVHSLWLVPLCLALGAGLAWWLYRRSSSREGFAPRLAWLLAVLRALTIALVAFFLLEPMIHLLMREVKRPIAVVLHDGSRSLAAVGDTAALRGAYMDRLNELVTTLGDGYEVRAFTYGERVREGLEREQMDGATDMAMALREVYDRFSGPDLGLVIMDGDGIVNRGRDPRLEAARLGVPIHVVAMGDTTVRPDLSIRAVEHNRISFLGNEFPVTVRLEAHHLNGRRTRVVIRHGGSEISAQEIVFQGDPWRRELAFLVKADQTGMQRYVVHAVPVDGEATQTNNTVEFFIDVLDGRQRVLVVAAAPHPDVAAIRSALNGLEGYESELAYASDFSAAVDGFDLVVLHQLPSAKQGMQPLLARAQAQGIPLLFVVGAATDMAGLNAAHAGVQVTGWRPATTDAQAVVREQFNYFVIEGDLAKAMEGYPPLQIPFGQYIASRGAEVLALQRIGVVRTEAPMIVVQQLQGHRTAVICGEGIWRWRMADRQLFGSHERFDRFVHKLVQFLALKADKKRFRVEHAPLFTTSEPVLMTAELYNAAYESVPDAEVNVVLKDSASHEYPSDFRSLGSGYRLDAGRLPAGRYTWSAQAVHKGERFSAQGELHVRQLLMEQASTVADHSLLADIAARTGGLLVTAGDLRSLENAVKGEKSVPARSFLDHRYTDLVASAWPFSLIVLLLAIEWLLRRRNGAY
ncbi:MAG: hypothetical protein IPM46_05330 [Flavobacteriales bacterium]|nr:hypothetical protein [Flavobacteriales bacterium]